jgi:hypothetical protein
MIYARSSRVGAGSEAAPPRGDQLESLEAHGGNGRVKMRARPVLADEQPTSPR